MWVLRLRPGVLLALGLVFLAVAVLVDLFVYGGSKRPRVLPTVTAPPAATSPATTSPAPVPVPVPAPFAVTGAAATGDSGFSESLTWETPQPSTGQVRWGPSGTAPVLWADAGPATTSHLVTLTGLLPTTSYEVEIEATAQDGTTARGTLTFSTPPASAAVSAVTRGGVLLVNGAPFFPLIAWQQCPDQWAPNLAQGIDLFAGNPCTGLGSLLTALQGRALAVGTSDDTPITGPGLIGWFYPDEADGRGLTASTLPAPPVGGVSFLTLTGHFYSGSAPLPDGRGQYPGLIAKAGVVGFDLYPLQEWCRPDRLGEVFDAQRQLVALAPGKPTFQWIEVREMKCPNVPVTQADIRAESWLAIAGGAHGLGFFPADWGAKVGATIHGIATRIKQLAPALVRATLPVAVGPTGSRVRASARELHGALYLLAVNPADTPTAVTLRERSLGDRTLEVLGQQRTLKATRGTIADVLPPLAVRIYIAAPH
jgi:hypothetical protein